MIFSDGNRVLVDGLDLAAVREALAFYLSRTGPSPAREIVRRTAVKIGNGGSGGTPAEETMDVIQLATLLEVSPRQARNISASIGFRVGGRWRISRSAALDELHRRMTRDTEGRRR